ncbi:unnamed protein product [Caenorhabditis nigoni]
MSGTSGNLQNSPKTPLFAPYQEGESEIEFRTVICDTVANLREKKQWKENFRGISLTCELQTMENGYSTRVYCMPENLNRLWKVSAEVCFQRDTPTSSRRDAPFCHVEFDSEHNSYEQNRELPVSNNGDCLLRVEFKIRILNIAGLAPNLNFETPRIGFQDASLVKRRKMEEKTAPRQKRASREDNELRVERRFQCRRCSKEFKDKNSMNDHFSSKDHRQKLQNSLRTPKKEEIRIHKEDRVILPQHLNFEHEQFQNTVVVIDGRHCYVSKKAKDPNAFWRLSLETNVESPPPLVINYSRHKISIFISKTRFANIEKAKKFLQELLFKNPSSQFLTWKFEIEERTGFVRRLMDILEQRISA